MLLVEASKIQWYLDYCFFYISAFPLPRNDFLGLFMNLEFCLFFSLSVIFYYSVIEKINFRYILVYILHLFFPFKILSNSIFFCGFLFYFKVTSNINLFQSLFLWLKIANNAIFPYFRHLRVCRNFGLAVVDVIFLIRSINKVIKPIAKHVK